MKPTYYVRAAPHQPTPHVTFSAFSIQPAQVELFDVAHVILIAEAVSRSDTTQQDNAIHPVPISQQAVALFCTIMQQEIALPVVRRLIEALRQANTVLYRQQQGVRIVVGLLIKDTLYLACVGNVSAYVIRGGKVVLLLSADRTRDRYLGHAAQLLLDYQLQSLPPTFVEQKPDHAGLPTDYFVLAPSDTLILCSNELAVKQIMPTVRNARRPERLAADLAKATAQYDTDQPSGVIALHWRVDKVGQAVKQLGLVLVIFLCVTLAMQSVIQLNQRVNRWMAVYAETGPVRQPPILGYRPNSVVSSVPATSAELTQTVQARALVRVHVNVNMEVASPSVVATFVPTLMPLPNSVDHSRIALQPPPTLPVTSTPDPTNVPTVMLFVPAPSPTILTPTIPPPALSTALLIPTVPIALVENSVPPVDTVAAELPLVSSAPTVTHVSLLAPPAEASSAGVMNFAWQSQVALPPGQAYEVIIWQDNQSPLADGLGIAAPIQEEHLTVQLEGLYAAGVIRPGAYQWGLLLVTVEPYTRVALLSSGRTFYFAATSQAPACDPDRATC